MYMKNIYEALYYIEKYFGFLYARGYKIVNQQFDRQSFGNWIVVFKSEECVLRFIQDRKDVNIEVGPSSSSIEISGEKSFTDLDQLVDYIKKKDINIFSSNTSKDIDIQLGRLSTLLSSEYSDVIQFVNNANFPKEKDKISRLFFEKMKRIYPNMKFVDKTNSNKESTT